MVSIEATPLSLAIYFIGLSTGFVFCTLIYCLNPIIKDFLMHSKRHIEVVNQILAMEKQGKYVMFLTEGDLKKVLKYLKIDGNLSEVLP